MTRWNPWFVAAFAIAAVCLIVAVFLIPFRWWSLAAFVVFGSFEFVGIHTSRDDLPPLTQIIRRYLPAWVAFALLYGLVGMCGAFWFQVAHPVRVGALFGLVGWLDEHFSSTYDAPGE
jgi:hypothetical protein